MTAEEITDASARDGALHLLHHSPAVRAAILRGAVEAFRALHPELHARHGCLLPMFVEAVQRHLDAMDQRVGRA